MKVSTIGGKPLITGGKVVITPGNPCPCGDCGGGGGGGGATGNCCYASGACEPNISRADCESRGGTFTAGGTCNPNICANQQPCDDNAFVEVCKCGFTEYASPSSPPKYYLVETYHSRFTTDQSCNTITPTITCLPGDTCIADRTITYDPVTCGATTVGSDSPNAAGNTSHTVLCNGAVIDPSGNCFSLEALLDALGTKTQTTNTYHNDQTFTEAGCTPSSPHQISDATKMLSSEYTTAMLIANALAQLPPSCDPTLIPTYTVDSDEVCVQAFYIAGGMSPPP